MTLRKGQRLYNYLATHHKMPLHECLAGRFQDVNLHQILFNMPDTEFDAAFETSKETDN